MSSNLPTDAAARKRIPLASGLLDYFPLALVAVAELSMSANDQHNPGEPLHWAREKSNDHDDCLMRHFLERGTVDSDGIAHRVKVAWRALAALQIECEQRANVRAMAVASQLRGDYPQPNDWRVDVPAESAYLASFGPNHVLTDFGIGDVEPRPVMMAEADRLNGPEDRL